MNVISPKQPAQLRDRDWYPYYAGFTEAFVDSVLATKLQGARNIIDPWNGAGTTTAVCKKRSVSSTGIDINPALTVIARGRLVSTTQRTRLNELAREILSNCNSVPCFFVTEDLLNFWFQPTAVQKIRIIQRAIHQTTTRTTSPISSNLIVRSTDEFTNITCFFYCALFGVVRDLLRRFRTTNPMWIKTPPNLANRIRPSWSTLTSGFMEHVSVLCYRLTIPTEINSHPKASVITSNATKLPLPTASFDGAITSPPYATRIDYVKGTLPELAILGADNTFLANLRKVVTGTPVVRNIPIQGDITLNSKSGQAALNVIASHSSKGSNSYYLPWLRNYLKDLQTSIEEITRTVKKEGNICMVVRDSYYKEYRIDLQTIVVELMRASDRALQSRSDYSAMTPRSKVVKNRNKILLRTTKETVLIF